MGMNNQLFVRFPFSFFFFLCFTTPHHQKFEFLPPSHFGITALVAYIVPPFPRLLLRPSSGIDECLIYTSSSQVPTAKATVKECIFDITTRRRYYISAFYGHHHHHPAALLIHSLPRNVSRYRFPPRRRRSYQVSAGCGVSLVLNISPSPPPLTGNKSDVINPFAFFLVGPDISTDPVRPHFLR